MKPLLFREVKRKLEAAGFSEVGQTGSHIKFAKSVAGERGPQLSPTIAKWLLAPFEVSYVKLESLLKISRSSSPSDIIRHNQISDDLRLMDKGRAVEVRRICFLFKLRLCSPRWGI